MSGILWTSAFVGSFLLACAVLGGVVLGCVAVSILLSPWWLFIAIPVGVFLLSAAIQLCTWILNEA